MFDIHSPLQSPRGRDVQPGVAAHVFCRMKRRVRGKGPGKRADPEGVAHTGSTALTQGESKNSPYRLFPDDLDVFS